MKTRKAKRSSSVVGFRYHAYAADNPFSEPNTDFASIMHREYIGEFLRFFCRGIAVLLENTRRPYWVVFERPDDFLFRKINYTFAKNVWAITRPIYPDTVDYALSIF